MTSNALYFYQKVRDFLNVYLPNSRGASPNTVNAYREAMNAFNDYIASRGKPLEQISFDCISRESVEDFLDWLENDKDYSISSRNQRLAAIKSFLKYSSEQDKTLMALNLELDAIKKKKDSRSYEIDFLAKRRWWQYLRNPIRTRRMDSGIWFLLLCCMIRVPEYKNYWIFGSAMSA